MISIDIRKQTLLDKNVTFQERKSELRHWEGELTAEKIGHAHRSEAEQNVLQEATQRLERLRIAVQEAGDAGDDWLSHDPKIQVALNQVRQTFMWLDAEVQRMNASC